MNSLCVGCFTLVIGEAKHSKDLCDLQRQLYGNKFITGSALFTCFILTHPGWFHA